MPLIVHAIIVAQMKPEFLSWGLFYKILLSTKTFNLWFNKFKYFFCICIINLPFYKEVSKSLALIALYVLDFSYAGLWDLMTLIEKQ